VPEALSFHQSTLIQLSREWVTRAEQIFGEVFILPEIRFDLRGRSAGQYRGGPVPCIRYNIEMAEMQFELFCQETPAHEVAHYVVDRVYTGTGAKPHGIEWRSLMKEFGLNPSRCHQFDTGHLPKRKQNRFSYRCGCRVHQLTTTRHNRILRGKAKYHCLKCGQTLTQTSAC